MEFNKQQLINHLLSSDNFTQNNDKVIDLIEKLKIAPSYPIILVGGTNGKGSTCAFLSTILTNAGYKVGTFTSPHIFEYNERIKINNHAITDNELVKYLNHIIANGDSNLGIFKTFTLAAHLCFMEQKIDIAVIEVGIGGAKDTTNLFEPTISAITGVALDHCDTLGDTIEKIGLEKSGIYRTNKLAFFGSKQIPASIINYAKSIKADLIRLNHEYTIKLHDNGWDFLSQGLNIYSIPFPNLRGSEQVYNAALAIAILSKLTSLTPVNSSQIKAGLLQTSLIGRFQVMAGTPQVVMDTAHNPQAIEIMCENMLKLGFAKSNAAVFAIAKDKDYKKIIAIASKYFTKWYIAPLNSHRDLDLQEVANTLIEHKIKTENILINTTIAEAFSKAYLQLNNDDRLVVFGSFITIEQSYLTFSQLRK